MKYVLIPSWVTCLDEYIYICNKNLTFPGLMFVPRIPYTKEMITITYAVERVE